MLDSVTKKRIDDLRNILVGKIPSPQSQVEQITTGLIYKFMYDMDVEAVEMGGVPSFFVDDYEKYSWKHLFDPKLGGADKVQLYSDAIENMYTNPSAPQLFREIFKNSFLPFKDPSTLNMFLKEINEFHYSHSEKLGDAFEYLLSFMGSQGDAGQFRTPRHIIDFIVEIVNPQKNETILDPACGTAGFLISSYKHILSQNTDNKLGDKLNASERKQVGDNLVGYDISPDMTRISLVNMYLHQFASPQIHEYDTLSSEDRWNEYFDVVLANPPFMTPKGGIQPHSRFGVQSNRAEVLFVDYILGHLKPTGRAGIVVPEGIIFQKGTAYKTLRKKLVEDCLVGVISLPAGVFQPYAGVKTSILILDKEQGQKSDSIFFAKVENDGFSLGAQRTPITKNDLPEVLIEIERFYKGDETILQVEDRSVILENSECSLSANTYKKIEILSQYPLVTLEEIATVNAGNPAPQNDDAFEDRGIPFVRTSDVGKIKFGSLNTTSDNLTIDASNALTRFERGSILFPKSGASTLLNHRVMLDVDACVASHLAVIKGGETCIDEYLLYVLSHIDAASLVDDPAYPSLNLSKIKQIQIPLPPIEVQQQIVDELEGYQKIIDGCRQVVENYKPTIDIDPSWEMVALKNLYEANLDSKRVPITKGDRKAGEIPYYGASGIVDYVEGFLFDEDLLLISEDGANLKDRNYPIAFSISGKTWVNNHAHVLRFNDRISQKYVEFYFNQISLEPYLTGSAQPKLNQATLNSIKVPIPPKEDMERIVDRIEEEKGVIGGNSKLMSNLTQKIQDRISKVWGSGVEPFRPSNEEIMEQIESGVLVHPQNDRWHDFFKFLKSKISNDVDVPNPLILGGSGANDFSKNQRLKEHLTVAEQNGLLAAALEFLSKIPESQWKKSSGNLDPNELDYWQLDELHRKETEEKWFFKTVENMQVNLATMDTDKAGRILFVTETGWVFDEITCLDSETAEKKLRQNGFKRCDEDEKFSELFNIPDITIPETLDKELGNPIYSSGKFWRD